MMNKILFFKTYGKARTLSNNESTLYVFRMTGYYQETSCLEVTNSSSESFRHLISLDYISCIKDSDI
jgi:hypothetical protein